MRSIAMMGMMGSVGKTTSIVNISAALAASGKRVCVVDLDPQAHATIHLGVHVADNDKSIYNVLIGKSKIAEIRHQVSDHCLKV